MLRNWSLITGRGATKWERGQQRKFYPYKKGEAENVLGMVRGGAEFLLRVVLTWELEVLASHVYSRNSWHNQL